MPCCNPCAPERPSDAVPDSIIATKYVNDDPTQGIAKQRPLCPYRQVAQWKGHGSTNDAVNFRCVTSNDR